VTSAYVYYRIDSEQMALAATRVDALLGAMALHCNAPPRRLSRCDDATTWMEVYEGVADFAVFATALDTAARTFECSTFTRGERHLECFRAADPAT
jgi:hypothetical protein